MSFDDDERSVSQNRPIDLYTITTPTAVYRLTSHVVDVQFGGVTFTATTMSRGNLQLAQDPTGREFTMYLPISHPLVQRFSATGIPEHSVVVTLQRLQSVSNVAFQQWSGFATNMSIDGHTAIFQVPSVLDDAMKIKLPVIRAQKLCNHVLYDSLCTVARGGFTVNTTMGAPVIVPGSVTLPVASMGGNPDQWAAFGEVLHVPSQQRVMILSQTGTSLVLNVPFVGANAGDAVQIFAGCAHDVTTCRDKFANVVNFGGMPQMDPAFAPWLPGQGLSSVQQP